MNKFSQFVKWCGRKIWQYLTNKVFNTPKFIGNFITNINNWFKDVKSNIREQFYFVLSIWTLLTIVVGVLSLLAVAGILSLMDSHHIAEILTFVLRGVGIGSAVLFVITCFSAAFDIFEEEQKEIMRRLKQ